MLSSKLSDQQDLEHFISDKTDRQIAVAGLTIIDSHVRECTDRWGKIYRMFKFIGLSIGALVAERIATDLHIPSDFVSKFFSWIIGA